MKGLVAFFIWLVTPVILSLLIFLAHSLIYRTAEGEHRLSVVAGHWAGIIAFIAFVIYHSDVVGIPRIGPPIRISIFYFLGATLMGYFLLYAIKNTVPSRLGGLTVLLFVFAGSSALFSYFFITDVKNIILSITLGLFFGFMAHTIVTPRSIYEIFPEQYEDPFSASKASQQEDAESLQKQM